ncbi:MAG: thioesterase [Lachnospiraceae bacterium]|nr:thioesterase [Lachnospiraceae bacterium]
MYEFDSRIRYSETDSEGQLTWLALMDYFQDCSVFHSEQVNLSVDYLIKQHMAWILSSWQICVNRMPHLAEPVTIQTWPYGMKGFFGYRNFSMNDKEGNRLAYANSIWVLMDLETGHPVRVPKEMPDRYGIEEQLPMECSSRKIAVPDIYEEREPLVVPGYFIDTNHHMNNSRYVQVALEYLPEDFSLKEIRVEYRKAAVQGDVLLPRVTMQEEQVVVALCAEDSSVYALVELIKR